MSVRFQAICFVFVGSLIYNAATRNRKPLGEKLLRTFFRYLGTNKYTNNNCSQGCVVEGKQTNTDAYTHRGRARERVTSVFDASSFCQTTAKHVCGKLNF